MRILVAVEPVDGRKGIDSLANLCQQKLADDPFSGCERSQYDAIDRPTRVLYPDGVGAVREDL